LFVFDKIFFKFFSLKLEIFSEGFLEEKKLIKRFLHLLTSFKVKALTPHFLSEKSRFDDANKNFLLEKNFSSFSLFKA